MHGRDRSPTGVSLFSVDNHGGLCRLHGHWSYDHCRMLRLRHVSSEFNKHPEHSSITVKTQLNYGKNTGMYCSVFKLAMSQKEFQSITNDFTAHNLIHVIYSTMSSCTCNIVLVKVTHECTLELEIAVPIAAKDISICYYVWYIIPNCIHAEEHNNSRKCRSMKTYAIIKYAIQSYSESKSIKFCVH